MGASSKRDDAQKGRDVIWAEGSETQDHNPEGCGLIVRVFRTAGDGRLTWGDCLDHSEQTPKWIGGLPEGAWWSRSGAWRASGSDQSSAAARQSARVGVESYVGWVPRGIWCKEIHGLKYCSILKHLGDQRTLIRSGVQPVNGVSTRDVVRVRGAGVPEVLTPPMLSISAQLSAFSLAPGLTPT